MPKEKVRRERKTYSVFRLEFCPAKSKPQDPTTEWVLVNYFETENDAIIAAQCLKTCEEYTETHFGVVREIREKEVTPKSNRKVV